MRLLVTVTPDDEMRQVSRRPFLAHWCVANQNQVNEALSKALSSREAIVGLINHGVPKGKISSRSEFGSMRGVVPQTFLSTVLDKAINSKMRSHLADVLLVHPSVRCDFH